MNDALGQAARSQRPERDIHNFASLRLRAFAFNLSVGSRVNYPKLTAFALRL